VVLGDTAAGTFLKVFDARDRLLVDQDVLCVGPTPSCDDLDAWKSLRDQFWNGIVPGGIDAHVQSPILSLSYMSTTSGTKLSCASAIGKSGIVASVTSAYMTVRLSCRAGCFPSLTDHH